MSDFFNAYMQYVNLDKSEAPATYHRWTLIATVGALLGKNVWLPFGHGKIYPNQFIMLIGPPGARKGSAMKLGKRLLRDIGYNRFAKDRTSKERFLMDMKQFDDMQIMSDNQIEALTMEAPSETFIAAEEFLDFIGPNDQEFIMMLTNLWDCPEPLYEHPKIHGKSTIVENPVVNMFGGATAQTFALAVPAESLETGFLSRLLLIYSDPSGVKIAWPPPADDELGKVLKDQLKDIRAMHGRMTLTPEAKDLAENIYHSEIPVDDMRFKHYQQRRYIHMLKLSTVIAASDLRYEINSVDVLRANTMLAVAESQMPKALGEFGNSRFADANGKIIAFLDSKLAPQTAQDIWKRVNNDVHTLQDLVSVLKGLQAAGKIQPVTVKGKSGYLLNKQEAKSWPTKFLDLEWLTERERPFIEGA